MKEIKNTLLSLSLSFLTYVSLIMSPTIGIDTEGAVLDYSFLVNSWRRIDREGLALLKDTFFPTYLQTQNNILAIFALAVFALLIIRVTKFDGWIVSLLVIACPITYFQMYFQMQSFEVILASIITLLLVYATVHSSSIFVILTIVGVGFCIGVYQSIVDFYIGISALLLLLKGSAQLKDYLKLMIGLIGSLIVYWFLNNVINTSPKSSYLSINTFSRHSIFAFSILLLLLVIILALWLIGKINLHQSLTLYFFLASPFLTLSIIGALKYRALFPALPMVIAVSGGYLYSKKKLPLRIVVVCVASFFLIINVIYQVAEIRRFKIDRELAQAIINQIPSKEYRVQFIGKYSEGNTLPDKMRVEPAGTSFFGYEKSPDQGRSDNMLKLMNANFVTSTMEQNTDAVEKYKEVDYFNHNRKVYIDDNEKVVVVKFK
ncbi:glucosyltransferase domain-containing protein [Streptococcus halotolerans]|uniref:glucosyltransferase domain-containing protein n=1 Tax=Streptococcus halotolerans TaxID=1814128 RepID=UPI000786F652|nr:glucosyltransferase domain-containing protein [Streptococcus halotolerans]